MNRLQKADLKQLNPASNETITGVELPLIPTDHVNAGCCVAERPSDQVLQAHYHCTSLLAAVTVLLKRARVWRYDLISSEVFVV